MNSAVQTVKNSVRDNLKVSFTTHNKRQVFPTIPQAFLNRVRTQPDTPAFHYKEGTQWKAVTWREYYDTVRLISLGLMQLGFKKGDRACVLSSTRLEWAASDMAILGTLGTTVPIYPSSTAEDSAYIADHCEAKVMFIEDNKQLEKIFSVRKQLPKVEKFIVFNFSGTPETSIAKDVMSLTALTELGKRALANQANVNKFDDNILSLTPNDPFTICYTSGTTGVPKGVVLQHDCLTSLIEDIEKVLGQHFSESDMILSFLPISHIFGKIESMAAYQFGWKVYYAESIEKVLLNLGEVKPTLMFAVPRIFEKAYNKIKAGVDDSPPLKKKLFYWAVDRGQAYYDKIWTGKTPSLREFVEYQIADKLVFKKVYAKFGGRIRFCIAGGAPLPKAIGEFMRILGISILEGYGLTETCAAVTVNLPEALRFGTIGKPLPEVAIKIADDGEILIKSRKVFSEYFKNPDATKESIINGWFHTGDIGVIDDDGFVKITDRKKDLIVTSGGKNIAPQKIENLAKTQKYINQIMIHGDKRNYLTALIVLEKEDIIKYAKEENILFSEYNELIKNPKIIALIQKTIDKVNEPLANYETVKRFTILPAEFTIESGELTPSLKIRRKYCNEKYKAVLDAMYGSAVNS